MVKLLLIASIVNAYCAKLTIDFSTPADLSGEIAIVIFDKEDSFLKDSAATIAKLLPSDKHQFTLDLPKGSYALSSYLDSNSNQELY